MTGILKSGHTDCLFDLHHNACLYLALLYDWLILLINNNFSRERSHFYFNFCLSWVVLHIGDFWGPVTDSFTIRDTTHTVTIITFRIVPKRCSHWSLVCFSNVFVRIKIAENQFCLRTRPVVICINIKRIMNTILYLLLWQSTAMVHCVSMSYSVDY